MAGIDAAFGWMFSYADASDPAAAGTALPPDAPFAAVPRPAPSLLRFADVAAGPGGFTEYLLWRRGASAQGVGFTLRGEHDFKTNRFHYKALPELFHPYYGPRDDGDLYTTANLRALQALVDRQTGGERLHVVMGDGGFDVSGAENIQEVLNKQLLLTQFACALGCLRTGGHFVCKAFDLFTPFSAGLLYVMYRAFDAVCVYKPAASRPANSERYVVCRGLKPGVAPLFEHLLAVNDRLNALKHRWQCNGGDGGRDVVHVTPAAQLQASPVAAYLTESNSRLGVLQTRALRRLVAMLRNPGERCGDQSLTRDACLAAWRLPSDAPPPAEFANVEEFYAREVVMAQTEEIPRAATVQPLRGRDFDVESSVAKLRRADDWVVLEASADAPPVLMLGADGDGRRGLAFTWDANHSLWQLRAETRLPRATLLLVEVVAEQLPSGEFRECCHAIDAGVIAGEDLRRAPYAERRRRLALLVEALQIERECLDQESGGAGPRGRPPYVPLKLKPCWGLAQMAGALDAGDARREAGGPQWRHRGVLLFPAHNVSQPLQPAPPQWTREWSRKAGAEYWFNKANGQTIWVAEVEKQVAKPISFRSCAANFVRWDRSAVLTGGMDEQQLRKLAEAMAEAAAERKARAALAEREAAARLKEESGGHHEGTCPMPQPLEPTSAHTEPTGGAANPLFDGLRF